MGVGDVVKVGVSKGELSVGGVGVGGMSIVGEGSVGVGNGEVERVRGVAGKSMVIG